VAIVVDDEGRPGPECGAKANELEGDFLELRDRREEIHPAQVDEAAVSVVRDVRRYRADGMDGVLERHFPQPTHVGEIPIVIEGVRESHMRRLMIVAAVSAGLASYTAQSTGHPFISARITASIDSFVIMSRPPRGPWRPVGGVVQTVARDTNALRIAVDYSFVDSRQRVEMAMDLQSLAPLAHWEQLARRGRGDATGEVMFRDGRAKGAFILSKSLIDVPLDSGIVDDDASTALLPALPVDSIRSFVFRTFASPGQLEVTRIEVQGIDTVSVPAGTFVTHRLLVMARDTSQVYLTTKAPRRVVLVRLSDGSQEMRLINRR
jgi:hypothetical protein